MATTRTINCLNSKKIETILEQDYRIFLDSAPIIYYIQDLRHTAIYGAKKCHFQDIATTISAVV